MKYQIINEKLNIAACNLSDLTIEQASCFLEQWKYGAVLKDLTLFFESKTGLLVLNKDHNGYGTLLELVQDYMMLNEEKRMRVRDTAPASMKETLDVLEGCIKHRYVNTEIFRATSGKIKSVYTTVLGNIAGRFSEYDAVSAAFKYGMMCGKREERIKRKGNQNERGI